jgi:hypothetical protein
MFMRAGIVNAPPLMIIITIPAKAYHILTPNLSATGPAKTKPRGVIDIIRLIIRVKILPWISAGTRACINDRNEALAMEFIAPNIKRSIIPNINAFLGRKLKRRMLIPLMDKAIIAVLMRLLKPPQIPNNIPPVIIPTPFADWSQASSNAPPLK